MSKIHAVATAGNGPISTKSALRSLVKSDPGTVKLIPANPSPGLAYGIATNSLPFGVPVTVHTGKVTAEIERKSDGKIVVR
jgi:hypothetical protein